MGRHSRMSLHAPLSWQALRRSMISMRRESPRAFRIASRWLEERCTVLDWLLRSCTPAPVVVSMTFLSCYPNTRRGPGAVSHSTELSVYRRRPGGFGIVGFRALYA